MSSSISADKLTANGVYTDHITFTFKKEEDEEKGGCAVEVRKC
jgi:hypothetical protein